MSRRVVITGVGVVSSIGTGRDDFWSALIKGESGISKISSFDTSDFSNHYGGEIKNFNPEVFIERPKLAGLGRASCLAVSGAMLAVRDAKLNLEGIDKERFGVAMGTTMAESQIFQEVNENWVKKGEGAINPDLICRLPANVLSCNVAIEFGLKGPNYVISTACAAGNYAIGYAYDLVRTKKADMMLAGGADAFSRIAFTGFNRLLAVAPELCQPFDKDRKGMLVGEGAAALVIEPLEDALNRGADIYAEIIGYGLSCDAHHMTAPYCEGIKEAIEKSLQEAKLAADDVGYFSAHGTGTPSNDKEECLAIKKAFGGYAKKLPVSSIKSMLGHTMGAASAIEAVTCCLVLKNGIMPPTINFKTPDPECDIDCIPNTARYAKVDIALNNASAFGGNNACLVLKKYG
ncbi:MAG: beta-ketoacyl-[acyl-carrier-protein] synthase family protein [Candidatus Omnitrophica bacterium]|nr:beta-ketoacyl-[acyl-carrier-protein] synthase family protein [Candidatus Omnitrophota bacterium]MBL7210356.1 beta-ketoacyl-[acyl-carrier-protein] synthase family protein [Candidatus Omnitrophota bacterium]